MSLVDITVRVANGGWKEGICESYRLDDRHSMRSQFSVDVLDGINYELTELLRAIEVSTLVAS